MTTAFNTPITSPQYTMLRANDYSGQFNLSLFSNRVVFKAQVNIDLSNTQNWAQLTFYNVTVGAYTDIEKGQTVIVSPVDDVTKYVWRGRTHSTHAATSATLFTNESSAKLQVNWFIYVLDVFEVFDELSRPDVSVIPPNQLIDFDVAYHQMFPQILGLQYVYVGAADETTHKFRIALNLTGIAMESGATISSWLISPRSGQATLISGSYSSAVATFDLDASTMAVFGETWFQVAVTDSNGIVGIRHCGVKLTDSTHPADTGFDSFDGSADVQRGWTARLPAFIGVDSVLPGTLGVVWRSNEEYGMTAGPLLTPNYNTIDAVVYLRKDDPKAQGDNTHSVVSGTTFELVDIAARMQAIECQALALFDDSSAVWDHMANLTPRRAIWHILSTHSTIATLVDVLFDSFLSDDRYVFPLLSTPGNNLLTVCNGLGQQVNAALEFAPDGRIGVNRTVQQLSASDRGAATTVADWTSTDGIVVGSSRVYEDKTGVIDANGAVITGSTAQVFQSRAPGIAQGISQGTTTLPNQILANDTAANAQAELNQRAGNAINIDNSQETLTVEHPDGYNFFVASRSVNQLFTWTLDTTLAGPNGVNRLIYDTSVLWIIEQIQYHHDNTGQRKVNVTYRRVSDVGYPAYTVPIPPQPTATPLPGLSLMLPAFPALNQIILPAEGVTATPVTPTPTPVGITPTLHWTATGLWISNNVASKATPTYFDITPPSLGSFQIKHAILDLFGLVAKTVPVYVLISDGVNSKIAYCTDANSTLPAWTEGANVTGVYTLVRLTQTAGEIEIKADAGGTTTTTNYDFTATDGGFTAQNPSLPNTWVAGVGWEDGFNSGPGDRGVAVGLTMSSINVVKISLTYVMSGATASALSQGAVIFPSTIIFFTKQGLNGTHTDSDINNAVSTRVLLSAYSSHGDGNVGSTVITGATIVTSTGNALVALSTDHGATFSAPVTVGGAPSGIGGFDVQHQGTVTLAAQDQKTRIATTLGGAFSDATGGGTTGAEPILLLQPWKIFGSTSSANTGATPDFLLGSSAAVSGASLWAVHSGTAHDITPAAGAVPVGPNCAAMWQGTRIAILVTISGVVHLYTGVIASPSSVTWTDRGAVTAGLYIRGRYHAASPGPLYVAGDAVLYYSNNFGAALHSRSLPVASGWLGVEPGL